MIQERVIKYRGRDSQGRWHYGGVLLYSTGAFIVKADLKNVGAPPFCIPVVRETIGEYREFKDDFGNEVYEDDVLANLNPDGTGRYPFISLHGTSRDVCAYVQCGQNPKFGRLVVSKLRPFRVVGNIHDNPEMNTHEFGNQKQITLPDNENN